MTLIHRILDQLANDQYRVTDGETEQDQRDRRHWNAGVQHAVLVIKTLEAREHVEAGLRELSDAEPTDRSFKAALIAESIARGPLPADWPGPFDLSEHDGGDE